MKDLKLTVGKGKGKNQEIQGVMVQKVGDEFEFNFQTALNPAEDDLEMLKEFRNKFVNALEVINDIFKFRVKF